VVVHLDTHVLVWLAGRSAHRLSRAALGAIESADLRISPIVLLELQYLHGIGRTPVKPDAILLDLTGWLGLTVSDTPFATVVEHARGLDWTRDPFDRLIAASAIAEAATLVTADETIRRHLPGTVW
jgi:PIN domain nuclease of toxin-antitoxin system